MGRNFSNFCRRRPNDRARRSHSAQRHQSEGAGDLPGVALMKIISGTDRITEPAGVKAAIVGPPGIGKTSLLKTLDDALLASSLFIDIEAGDLAVASLPVTTLRPTSWRECRDLAVILGGPNADLPPSAAYSQAHFDAAARSIDAERLAGFRLIFVDSITAAESRCRFGTLRTWRRASTGRRGTKDLRGTYGLHSRQMLSWLYQLQQARGRHVILIGILEQVKDDYGRIDWEFQLEGRKTGRELPGIIDEVITMQFVDFGDGKPVRAFICMALINTLQRTEAENSHLWRNLTSGKLITAADNLNVTERKKDHDNEPTRPRRLRLFRHRGTSLFRAHSFQQNPRGIFVNEGLGRRCRCLAAIVGPRRLHGFLHGKAHVSRRDLTKAARYSGFCLRPEERKAKNRPWK